MSAPALRGGGVVITFPELSAGLPSVSLQLTGNCFNSSVQHDCPHSGHFSLRVHSWSESNIYLTQQTYILESRNDTDISLNSKVSPQ